MGVQEVAFVHKREENYGTEPESSWVGQFSNAGDSGRDDGDVVERDDV